ncbi:Uncharacterized conserved protein [Halopenitus malekzadehii]|uniref:Uncharacterized conserved protein n=1 Tax=Halopenitus malekzadehii TaxID=1267564 RepID=A0A1H6IY48_9EURY|nr:hypothetical protein [Halopenitus malekzadehii]SEH53174.1 Uncharacterized conserved protein [Halopenitus malekzadehii]
MRRSRLLPGLLVLAVLGAAVGIAAQPAAADDPNVRIDDVTVSPASPTTDETVTLDVVIENLESSTSAVDVTSVNVRTSGGVETHGRIENVGSLGPGGSVTVPLSATFEEPGDRLVTVYVTVRGPNGAQESYQYPVSIEVEEPVTTADLTATTAADGDAATVTFANYGNTNASEIAMTATVDDEVVDRRYIADVAPDGNGSTDVDLSGVQSDAVTFTATYTAADAEHSVSRTVELDRPVDGEVRLTGLEVVPAGSGIRIQGDAANLGGTDAESVLVRVGEADGVTPVAPAREYFVGGIEASEFATFELTASLDGGVESVPVEISYLVDGDRVTTTQQVAVDGGAGATGGTNAAGDGAGSAGNGAGTGSGGGGPLGGLGGVAIGAIVGLAVIVAGVLVRRRRR